MGKWVIQAGGKSASHSVWSELIDVAVDGALDASTANRFCADALEQIRLITAKHSTPLIK